MNTLIGTRLGKYEVQAEIGRGGMGAVYRGYDPLLDRYVAVKVLAPHLVWETGFVERFLREARAAARLKHPNIVTIHDVGQEAGWYYFVMEYLEGLPLTTVVQQSGRLPFDRILSILRSLAEALDYAHHRGLVHRDVKPGNVIVSPAGQVTLTDFGIARATQEARLTATGTAVGTPAYMSPQQARGLAVDGRSDQYSMAVMAYEMLSGRVPFQAESTLALLYKIVHEPPPPIRHLRPDLPLGVERVLEQALAKEPGDRYATVSAFVDALGRALLGEAEAAAPLEMPVLPAETPAAPPETPPPLAEVPTVMETAEEVAPPLPVTPPPPVKPAVPAAAPAARPALTLRRVPVWVWALGGLAVLALVLGLVLVTGIAGGQKSPMSGPYLLLVSNRDGKQEIYRLTRTGEVERITHTPDRSGSWSPTLAPDGTLLFTSNRDGKQEIYRLTATGEIERITYTPGSRESWSPIMAPDGTLLFTSNRDGKQEIYRITATGEIERITHTPGTGESWSPTLAPDGTLLFTSNRDGKQEIYRLTGTGETERITHSPGARGSWSPIMAPDATLLFTSNRDGNQEIYRMTGTGSVERVTHTPGRSGSWSPTPAPDGTLLFTSNRDGKQEIYRLAGTGEIERITHTPGNDESWLPVR